MMNPVELAVAPLKKDAVEYAHQVISLRILKVLAELQQSGWDAHIVAPYPDSGTDSDEVYRMKMRKYRLVRSITNNVGNSRGVNGSEIVAPSVEKEKNIIELWEKMAAEQYDAFVAELTTKIGECVDAKLKGNHVWGESILTVTKADGTVERWKTHMINKMSAFGKPQSQWLSRIVE